MQDSIKLYLQSCQDIPAEDVSLLLGHFTQLSDANEEKLLAWSRDAISMNKTEEPTSNEQEKPSSLVPTYKERHYRAPEEITRNIACDRFLYVQQNSNGSRAVNNSSHQQTIFLYSLGI